MKKTLLIAALLALSSRAHAVSTINVPGMTCSGTQTSDLTSFLSLSCTGNLSLIGGTLSSDTKIVLTATGSMTLDNLTVTAPVIDLTGGNLYIGSGASLNAANSATIIAGGSGTSPFITTAAGGSVTIGSSLYSIGAGSGNSLQLGSGTIIPITNPGSLVGGTVSVFPGAGIVVAVPEPDIISLLPVGAITLAFLTGNRRRRLRVTPLS